MNLLTFFCTDDFPAIESTSKMINLSTVLSSAIATYALWGYMVTKGKGFSENLEYRTYTYRVISNSQIS